MLCDNLEAWDGVEGGREVQREATYIYLWLIHVDIWQKPTQHCKAIILHLKIKKKNFFKVKLNGKILFLFSIMLSICYAFEKPMLLKYNYFHQLKQLFIK